MVERILDEANKVMWDIILKRADKLHHEVIELREKAEALNEKWSEFLESHKEFERAFVAFKKYHCSEQTPRETAG